MEGEARDPGVWRRHRESVSGWGAPADAVHYNARALRIVGARRGKCEMAVSLLTTDDDKCLEMGNFFST